VATQRGVCDVCRERVPAEHVIREGKVYFRKDCPTCGSREALVSSDAAVWQRKRDICLYDAEAPVACTLRCESCNKGHRPRIAFIDVTSRCNLNCPICIANIPGMGVDFNPPLSYFETIFEELGRWRPKPRVELFGGEPTVRDDLFEIIAMARRHRLRVSVATNCVKLADEDYCKAICETEADLLLGFDGRDPEIYRRLRGSDACYEKKLQAIENLRKHTTRRHTLVSVLARGLNDHLVADLIEFAHERRAMIRRLFFIPLTEMWEDGAYETEAMTTPEDVEHTLQKAFPDRPMEFLPAGLFGHVLPALRLFGTERIRFAGVHPNCESAAFLVSDGERYRPLDYYLKRPLTDVAAEVVRRASKVNPRLERLDRSKRLHRWRGRFLAARTLGSVVLRAADLRKILKGNRVLTILRILGGLLVGRDRRRLLEKHTTIHDGVVVTVLPFEEWHSLDSARLERCSAGFIYVDPDTGAVCSIPFCIWCLYRRDTYRRIAEKFQPEASAPQTT